MRGGRKNLRRAVEEETATLQQGQSMMQVVDLRGFNLVNQAMADEVGEKRRSNLVGKWGASLCKYSITNKFVYFKSLPNGGFTGLDWKEWLRFPIAFEVGLDERRQFWGSLSLLAWSGSPPLSLKRENKRRGLLETLDFGSILIRPTGI
ncbi:putative RNA-binding protein EIF1AD [Forsythia ovata]|uniref:RNA-binding protein EIF1AD n=1 Tax=Forsythia ovata TaxID=205694 RepID=A0ABD1U8Y4_9LAMI